MVTAARRRPGSLALAGFALYLGSLPLLGIGDPLEGGGLRGYEVLAIGWLGLIGGVPTWYANPLLWLGWRWRASRPTAAAVAAAAALALGASFVWIDALPGDNGPMPVTRGIGYWVWLASLGAFLLEASAAAVRARSKGDAPAATA